MTIIFAIYFCIWVVYGGEVTNDLVELTVATKVAFFDFDKTTTIYGIGGTVLKECQGGAEYGEDDTTCSAVGELTTFFNNMANPTLTATMALGNDSRIARLKESYARAADDDSTIDNIYILSTSWKPVPAAEWASFIHEVFRLGGITEFVEANILTLEDPGEGYTADKGAVLQAKLDELKITDQNACIFSDDS
eukprot:463948_1